MPDSNADTDARVFLTRQARTALGRLAPDQRQALSDGFDRVGWQLLSSAQRVSVSPEWSLHTWPKRRYPQQCYPKTVKYVLEHLHIREMRLVHGVVSHAPHFMPLEHAWVELPGGIVFDGVVQLFFTRGSYYAVMAAVEMDGYSPAAVRRLVAEHRGPGPWTLHWVPTTNQLEAYAGAVQRLQDAAATSPLPVGIGDGTGVEKVGRKR